MGPGDVVRVRNSGQAVWKDTYGNVTYRVQPGSEGIVPFEAACLWFGHPDAIDIDPRNRHRSDEYARLRIRYGVYDDDNLWDQQTPNIEVFDLDGNRILTVVDDPLGDALSPDDNDGVGRQLLMARVADMEKQLSAMRAQAELAARGEAALANAGEIDDDGPTIPTSPIPVPALPKNEAEGQTVEVLEDSPTGVRVKVSRSN